MKKAALFVSLIFAAGTFLSGNAIAREATEQERSGAAGQSDVQKESPQQSQAQSESQQQLQSMREIDDLNGMTVQNAQGEKLGKISDVLVDIEAGQLGYAVVSSGGVLGMGEDKYIVPFRALKTGEGDSLLLDMPADRFKQAPQGQVEQAFSQEQGREIHQFYGISPYWEESGAQEQKEEQLEEQSLPESQSDQMKEGEEKQQPTD